MAYFGRSSAESDPFVQRLNKLRQSFADVHTSEDVNSIGPDALREFASADPEMFKLWKAGNPKAYVPDQPMIVGDDVFDVSGVQNDAQSAPYLGALARQRTTRQNADIQALPLGDPNREALEASLRSETGIGMSRDWGIIDEAQRAIAHNSGRQAVLDTQSLNLPDSETGAIRAPRKPRNSPNRALSAIVRSRGV